MTNHVVRLYAAALALVAFFLTWAVVAAHPWPPEPAADPRVVALERREQQLRRESARVQRAVAQRFDRYRVRLAARKREIAAARAESAAAVSVAPAPASAAAAPPVAVVSLPPVTSTRSS